jgi:signal transduction histidine kinase
MKLSLRWRILASIALINTLIFGIGLVFLARDLEKERGRVSDQLNQVIASLVVPLIDAQGDIAVGPILRSSAWRSFQDVMIVRAKFEEDHGTGNVRPLGAWLNPLGRLDRRGAFDEQAVLRDVRRAVETHEPVPSHAGFAIPIVDSRGDVWGGCWFRPPGGDGVGAVFGRLLPWFLLSTLLLTLGTFNTLRRFVLGPVGELSAGARRLAAGDLSARVAVSTRGGELTDLIHTFNAMAEKVEGYNSELARDVEIATQKVRTAENAAMTQRRLAATGELAAGIAHEINNPLGGLLNAVEALQRQNLTPTKREQYLALLRNGLERIQETVGKLLRFTPRTSTPVPLALVDPVVDALALVEHRARELGVALRLQDKPLGDEAVVGALRALPPVMGQANELGQAVLNLLVNALDALESREKGPRGRGRVDVRIEARARELALIVADDGPGVAAADLARVADLFYTTKDVGKGTGLGLSIVHGVVMGHGGRVHLESRPGEGFRVEIVLPTWTPARSDAGEP